MDIEINQNREKMYRAYLKYRQDVKVVEKQINQVRVSSWPELFGAMIEILNIRGVFKHIAMIRHTIGPNQSYVYNDEYYRTFPNDIEMYDADGEVIDPEYSDDDWAYTTHEAIADIFSIHEVILKEMVGRATITLTKDSYQVEFEED